MNVYCLICKFEVDPDDVAVGSGNHIICLECYEYQTGTRKIISRRLRRELQEIGVE